MLAVIAAWQSEFKTLGEDFKWVQLFENKGAAMGCSNPHPHGQIWAMDYIPTEIAQEDATQTRYYQQYQRPHVTRLHAARMRNARACCCRK